MINQISVVIVDDELAARDSLEIIINKEFPCINVAAKLDNAKDALNMIMRSEIDIVFLDIDLPVNDGFWLANKLSNLNASTCIIFTTAYNDFAIKAIKYAAFDFLLKPIVRDLLVESIERYFTNRKINNINQKFEDLKNYLKQEKIKFTTNSGFVMIAPENIVYCKADKNYSNLFLSNGKVELITTQLGIIEEILQQKSFVRISRSTLINLDYLDCFNRQSRTVILSNVIQRYEIKASSSGAKRLQKI